MATSFGIATDANGNGTTPDDIQVITGAEYESPGIIAGATVSPTSEMSYRISAGAVVIQLSTGRKIKTPVAAQTIPTTTAPTVGTRTDVIYIKQNTIAAEGDNAVVAGVGGTVPANAVEIGRYTVGTNITATSAATPTGNTMYARPVGGTLGVLDSKVDTDGTEHTSGVLTRGSMSIYVPTDRSVQLSLNSVISASDDAGGNTLDENGSVMYTLYVDNQPVASFERGYNRYWNTQQFNHIVKLNVGRHSIKYEVTRRFVPSGASGKWKVRYGGAYKFPGDVFSVIDLGVARV